MDNPMKKRFRILLLALAGALLCLALLLVALAVVDLLRPVAPPAGAALLMPAATLENGKQAAHVMQMAPASADAPAPATPDLKPTPSTTSTLTTNALTTAALSTVKIAASANSSADAATLERDALLSARALDKLKKDRDAIAREMQRNKELCLFPQDALAALGLSAQVADLNQRYAAVMRAFEDYYSNERWRDFDHALPQIRKIRGQEREFWRLYWKLYSMTYQIAHGAQGAQSQNFTPEQWQQVFQGANAHLSPLFDVPGPSELTLCLYHGRWLEVAMCIQRGDEPYLTQWGTQIANNMKPDPERSWAWERYALSQLGGQGRILIMRRSVERNVVAGAEMMAEGFGALKQHLVSSRAAQNP